MAVGFDDGTADVSNIGIQQDGMTFGEVLQGLYIGRKFYRKGWNGKGMYIHLQVPDKFSKMQRPYIYMKPADDALVPWVASQTDLLASDWMPVN